MSRLILFTLALAVAPVHAADTWLELRSTAGEAAQSVNSPAGFTGAMGFAGEERGYALSFGWRFAERVGVELSMRDYGDYAGGSTLCPDTLVCAPVVNPARGEADGSAVALLYTLPAGRKFSVDLRAGLLAWETRIQDGFLAKTASGTDTLFGVGLRWQATPTLSLGLGVETHELSASGLEFGLRWDLH
jgi:hypothetical protein